MIEIDFLANHPHYIPTLAAWHHAMWGHLDPNATLQARIDRLTSHVGRPAIPTTLIAFDSESLLGSASLVENDLRTYSHLAPFLASVFVAQQYRRQGIASALVQRVMVEAKGMGVEMLYLITPDQQALYTRLDWKRLEEVTYREEDVTLMVTNLALLTLV